MIKDINALSSDRIKRRVKGVKKVSYVSSSEKKEYLERIKLNQQENLATLQLWKEYWDSLYQFRTNYMKACDYISGRQLDEFMTFKGQRVSKKTAIKMQGKTPVVINVIQEILTSVIGNFCNSQPKSTVISRGNEDKTASEMLTNALHAVLDLNQASELDVQQLHVFLASGAAFFLIQDKWYNDILRLEGYIKNLNNNDMFFNSDTKDLRGDDIHTIGQIIETTKEKVIAAYCRSEAEIEALNEILKPITKDYVASINGLSNEQYKHMDFYIPSETSNVRIYMGWQLKQEFRVIAKDPLDGSEEELKGDIKVNINLIREENNRRVEQLKARGDIDEETIKASLITKDTKLVEFWTYKVLTTDGYCLEEGESPFDHKGHPYAFILRPLVNGEVYGFLAPLLQIQDVINEQFMMLKWLIESSAKGLLMIPTTALEGTGLDINDWAEAWSEVGGVILYNPKQGIDLPKEITSSSNDAGMKQMLEITLSIIDRIGGISKAMKGQEVNSGTPASLYLQMAQNSSINIARTMKSFESLLLQRDTKLLKIEIQLREDGDLIDFEGKSDNPDSKIWNNERIKDLPFKIVVKSGMDNPVYQMAIEDTLTKLLDQQQIDLKMYLKNTNKPFATSLLQQLEEKEQQAQQSTPNE